MIFDFVKIFFNSPHPSDLASHAVEPCIVCLPSKVQSVPQKGPQGETVMHYFQQDNLKLKEEYKNTVRFSTKYSILPIYASQSFK